MMTAIAELEAQLMGLQADLRASEEMLKHRTDELRACEEALKHRTDELAACRSERDQLLAAMKLTRCSEPCRG